MDGSKSSRHWQSRYGLLVIFLGVTILPLVVWFAHLGATGVGVPYQDPTPQQAAYQHYHKEISFWMIDIVLGGWMLGMVFGIATVCHRLFWSRAK